MACGGVCHGEDVLLAHVCFPAICMPLFKAQRGNHCTGTAAPSAGMHQPRVSSRKSPADAGQGAALDSDRSLLPSCLDLHSEGQCWYNAPDAEQIQGKKRAHISFTMFTAGKHWRWRRAGPEAEQDGHPEGDAKIASCMQASLTALSMVLHLCLHMPPPLIPGLTCTRPLTIKCQEAVGHRG